MAKLLKSNDRSYADTPLRVIGAEGEQLGVLKLDTACRKAQEAGLDLVLVAETSTPPVCKIMDFGKLCYEQKKKLKDQKRNQVVQKIKEIKFRLNIDIHDFEVKINHGIEFLQGGDKLKVTVIFRGRELAHPEKGFELIERISESLAGKGAIDSPAKLFGKNISAIYNPVK